MANTCGEILRLDFLKSGRTHDFALFKIAHRDLSQAKAILADGGYLGINKWYKTARIPIKASKKKPLTEQDKAINRELSSCRIKVENVLAKMKVFKILACRYRNHCKRLGLRLNLIVAIVNLEAGF